MGCKLTDKAAEMVEAGHEIPDTAKHCPGECEYPCHTCGQPRICEHYYPDEPTADHKLHSHPKLEQDLKVPEKHVIIDSSTFLKIQDMSYFTTKDLVEELAKREGVQEFQFEPHKKIDFNWKSEGPARILVVID